MKKIITSWDDGKYSDLRLAELLKKYNIPAIFYIPSNCELTEEDIEDLSKDFEIGGHTSTHPMDMKLLTDKALEWEIGENKDWLESILKKEITSFCYPRGRFDERVKKAVKNIGFKEARTTKVLNSEIPKDKFQTDTTIHITYPRDDYLGRDPFELAKWFIDGFYDGNMNYCHIWGHTFEADKFQLWDKLEDLFQYINKIQDLTKQKK